LNLKIKNLVRIVMLAGSIRSAMIANVSELVNADAVLARR
jgi:hypothetical protein